MHNGSRGRDGRRAGHDRAADRDRGRLGRAALEDELYANAKVDPDLLTIYKSFLDAMDNDFNTANAITAMASICSSNNSNLFHSWYLNS